MVKSSRKLLAGVAVLALVTAACSDVDDDDQARRQPSERRPPRTHRRTAAATAEARPTAAATTEAPATTVAAGVNGEITVFAAASLTEAFTEVGEAFTAANPDASATFSFDASSALVQQIIEGAPADVFASADTANMAKLTDAGLNGSEPEIFATNLLTIIVAPDNPLGITGVADLANPDLKVVICAPEVPCGNYANQILTAAAVTVTPVSLEQNVRGVVTKVTAGEADAGIVYVTDVTAAGDAADMVEIPADINVVAEYPIASVAASQNPEAEPSVHRLPHRPRRTGDPRRLRVRGAMSVAAPDPPVAVRHRRVGQERLPVPALILAVVAIAFFALPFVGLLWKAPWGDVWSILTSDSALTALRLSLWCSLWATVAAVVFGVPLAWLLARVSFPGRGLVRALCTLSMVLPPVVAGVALFYSLGRRGLLGQHLDRWFGFTLPFTTVGVVVAQTFVAMPFLVITVEAAFRQLDTRYEDAARTLGASRWYVFRRVTLPAIRPGLIAGAVLAWARALGEFGATITFAGNFPGRTQTMPLAIYLTNEINPDEAIVLSLVLIAVSFGVLVALRDRFLGGARPPAA